ncbi:MAG: hypothetical protein ABI366_08860 [Ginsengibacter sp.]
MVKKIDSFQKSIFKNSSELINNRYSYFGIGKFNIFIDNNVLSQHCKSLNQEDFIATEIAIIWNAPKVYLSNAIEALKWKVG